VVVILKELNYEQRLDHQNASIVVPVNTISLLGLALSGCPSSDYVTRLSSRRNFG
jgi:hypothetical protein